jgi:hypothetical protein
MQRKTALKVGIAALVLVTSALVMTYRYTSQERTYRARKSPGTLKDRGGRTGKTGSSAASSPSSAASSPGQKKAIEAYERRSQQELGLLQTLIDNLPDAQTVFQHPDPMEVQHADRVTVRVSTNLSANLTIPAIPLSGQQKLITEHDTIKVSPLLQVHLSGEPYFKVDSLNDLEQLVDKDITEWSFVVVPQKAGKWPLHLSVTRVFRTPSGTEKLQDYPAKDEYVTVNVQPLGTTLTNFAANNWQWLWTAVVVPLVVFLWNHRRKRKENASHPKHPRAA